MTWGTGGQRRTQVNRAGTLCVGKRGEAVFRAGGCTLLMALLSNHTTNLLAAESRCHHGWPAHGQVQVQVVQVLQELCHIRAQHMQQLGVALWSRGGGCAACELRMASFMLKYWVGVAALIHAGCSKAHAWNQQPMHVRTLSWTCLAKYWPYASSASLTDTPRCLAAVITRLRRAGHGSGRQCGPEAGGA